MRDKKYVDRVIKHFINGIQIDEKSKVIHFPFNVPLIYDFYDYIPKDDIIGFRDYLNKNGVLMEFWSGLYDYCTDTFGLTGDEIIYIWKQVSSYIDKKLGYL